MRNEDEKMGADLNAPTVRPAQRDWNERKAVIDHRVRVEAGAELADRSLPEGNWRYASVADNRRDGDEFKIAMGDWLGKYAGWQWFVTLTLGREVDSGFSQPGVGAARAALRDLLVLSRATSVVAVFERHRDGVPHVHALIAGCAAINGRTAEDHFRSTHGLARWKIFDRDGHAPGYVGKYLSKADVEMYMGKDGPWDHNDLEGTTLGGLRV